MVLPAVDPTKLTCSKCGIEIGKVFMVKDEELLQIGSLVVSEVNGNCGQCGEIFRYSLNARRLERLIRRAKDRVD